MAKTYLLNTDDVAESLHHVEQPTARTLSCDQNGEYVQVHAHLHNAQSLEEITPTHC